MIFKLTIHKPEGSYKSKEHLITEDAFCATVKIYNTEFLEGRDVLNDYDALARSLNNLLVPFRSHIDVRIAIDDLNRQVFVVRNGDNERLLTFYNTQQ